MDTQQVLESIQSLSVFAEMDRPLSAKIAHLLVDSGKPVSLNEGEVLINEGDLGGGAGFVLVSGTMTVEHDRQAKITIGAPSLLGEMHQFNPRAQRTATVRATTPCELLRFVWFDFNLRAQTGLTTAEQNALLGAMEQLVWQRFQHEAMFKVPAFSMLEDAARLRLCLTLVWLAREETCEAGAVLFEEGQPQGGVGLLLLDGAASLSRGKQPLGLIDAPGLLGVATEFNPQRRWTATGAAAQPLSLLRFNWQELEAYLQQRAGKDETQAMFDSIHAVTQGSFVG